MAITAAITGDALARGLRQEFRTTWRRRFQGMRDAIGTVMELGVPSDKYEELYGYYETAPYPRRRAWGDEVQSKGFRARNYTVANLAWDSSVQWYKHQRLFDQLKDLERAARAAGDNFATLDERVFYQIMQATADNNLLETIPNTPDGAALYSALDGDGDDRFGVSGGNVITGGAGIATSDDIRTDLFAALTRIAQFQDTEGQPAVDPGIIDEGVCIFYNVANEKVFREAFEQGRTLQVVSGEGVGAVTNIIHDSGMRVTLKPSQRITNDKWYVYVQNFDLKAIFSQEAQALEEFMQLESNSDIARSKKLEGIFWEAIRGFGVNIPLATVKVDV
jgi:hypothetical protein